MSVVNTRTEKNPTIVAQQTPKIPKQRINGILLLDKDVGLSSNHALQAVKRLLNAEKAGHTGSLDPLACGMLPICLGEATKFSQYLLDANKDYLVIAKLGVKTTTGDAEGEVIKKCQVPEFSSQAIEKVLSQFLGESTQIPSMYSAIKHNGEPLYKLARKGIEVERKARAIHIYSLKLLDQKRDTLTLEVSCSKGTYIRTLVEDIGEILGIGAHVIYLRRLSVAGFHSQQMITMSNLMAAKEQGILQQYLLPVATAVSEWPKLTLTTTTKYYLLRGQSVLVPKAPSAGWVQLFDDQDTFLGVGEILENGKVAPRRLLCEVANI